MSNFAKEIRNVIYEMPVNKIFEASTLREIQLSHIPEHTYYKTLERLMKYNEIMRLAKGVYYRSEINEQGVIPISEQAVVEHYTKKKTGFVIGEALYKEKNIISKENPEIKILSNQLKEEKKRVKNIEIEKIDFEINDKTIRAAQTLEILQNYQKLQNIDKHRFLLYMRAFAEQYSDESTTYVIENRKYKKSTIAFMRRILAWHGIDHSLDKYLSGLSEYKIPTIEELRLDIPMNIRGYLNAYVEELRKIYKENLDQVILYGSYARGDFRVESDIDVMILVKMSEVELIEYRDKLSNVTYDINMDYNIDIKPITQDKMEFERWLKVYPFYANIKRDGVVLYDAA